MKGSLSVNPEGVLLAIAKRKSKVENRFARVAKLADAPDLGLRNHRSIKAVAGIKAFYFRDPDQHNLEIIYFPKAKAIRAGRRKPTSSFSGSTPPPSEFQTLRRACIFIATYPASARWTIAPAGRSCERHRSLANNDRRGRSRAFGQKNYVTRMFASFPRALSRCQRTRPDFQKVRLSAISTVTACC
jgi:hypothetical protein